MDLRCAAEGIRSFADDAPPLSALIRLSPWLSAPSGLSSFPALRAHRVPAAPLAASIASIVCSNNRQAIVLRKHLQTTTHTYTHTLTHRIHTHTRTHTDMYKKNRPSKSGKFSVLVFSSTLSTSLSRHTLRFLSTNFGLWVDTCPTSISKVFFKLNHGVYIMSTEESFEPSIEFALVSCAISWIITSGI
eukprot:GHVQ01020995.1.p1 GENE.GHVQ01020995.1~~GHVQ01020995.1.p1  ORF type:complete len:189 (-),score=29.14 GHVQ01020995.1:406-972(-)